MHIVRLWHPTRWLGSAEQPLCVSLPRSKSISNRALIVGALRGGDPTAGLEGLSAAADTQYLQRALQSRSDTYFAGEGGTTFRFLAAYLATLPECRVLTGAERLLQRPIAPLVNALRQLGAAVGYLGPQETAPLRICGPLRPSTAEGQPLVLHLDAQQSSQFASAVLLIAPYLPCTLHLHLTGAVASYPYLLTTIELMRYFGAHIVQHSPTHMEVRPSAYRYRPLTVEADWSSASYWYAMTALSKSAHVFLEHLRENSWQGDRILASVAERLGIQTTFERTGARLTLAKEKPSVATPFTQDFLQCPDLAPTFVVLLGALGVPAQLSGLRTLKVKESDRCRALQEELQKVGVRFQPLPGSDGDTYNLTGRAMWDAPPLFNTHGDHRIAMALSILALLGPIEIAHPQVVTKSYPQFWEHLKLAGFTVEEISA